MTTSASDDLCPVCEQTLRDHHTCEPAEPDGLTKAEQAFIDLQRNRTKYGKWAAEVRKRWMASPAGLLAVRRLRG